MGKIGNSTLITGYEDPEIALSAAISSFKLVYPPRGFHLVACFGGDRSLSSPSTRGFRWTSTASIGRLAVQKNKFASLTYLCILTTLPASSVPNQRRWPGNPHQLRGGFSTEWSDFVGPEYMDSESQPFILAVGSVIRTSTCVLHKGALCLWLWEIR